MSSVARAPSYGSVTSSDLTSSAHEHAATKSTDVTSRTRPPLHQNRFSFTRSPVPSNHGQPTTDINANNPFVALTPWSEVSTYEVCKMVLMCIFLVPVLRVALCVLLFVPIVVLATISTAGHRPFNEHGAPVPLARWRRVVGVPIKWLIRCVLFVLGYYYIPVTKPAQTSQVKPRVIVANHSTYIDGIFLAAYTHGRYTSITLFFPCYIYLIDCSVAMMKEVADLPLIGPVIRSLDPILIERRSELGRTKALDDIHEHMVNQAFPPLVIFPQGMTCSQQFITKFKKGAFAEGLPVQPVLLRYPYKHLDISWFPSVNVIPLFFRHLCQFRMYLEVTFLEPYVPTSEEAKNPDLYAENVRQAMAAALPAKCTNHSFEDVRLLLQAGVGELFDLLDADQNGRIDFRELCIGLSSLNQPKKDDSPAEEYRDRLARFVFTLYDADNSGLLSRLELVAMLKQLRSTSGLYDDQTALDQLVAAFDLDGAFSVHEFIRLTEHHPELLDQVVERLAVFKSATGGKA
ncbi:hypothetical protein DYB37_007824 [Aphanomyces astaci]|uniref:EF-hand domain-containing protein n=2 Tax=Aphanomyces astaci TaxID=112090 RepID=A0A3R6XHV6_APHAT|nr:hypothetical protein DYB35_006039 [Aphanomyces astaci]RHZ28691.1 hypothetical protein DYB37_007824 [Aphanomyces astaci]